MDHAFCNYICPVSLCMYKGTCTYGVCMCVKNILVVTGEVKGQGSPVAAVAADGLTSAETFLHY